MNHKKGGSSCNSSKNIPLAQLKIYVLDFNDRFVKNISRDRTFALMNEQSVLPSYFSTSDYVFESHLLLSSWGTERDCEKLPSRHFAGRAPALKQNLRSGSCLVVQTQPFCKKRSPSRFQYNSALLKKQDYPPYIHKQQSERGHLSTANKYWLLLSTNNKQPSFTTQSTSPTSFS